MKITYDRQSIMNAWLQYRIDHDPRLLELQLATSDVAKQCPECMKLNTLCQSCDAKFAAWSKYNVSSNH